MYRSTFIFENEMKTPDIKRSMTVITNRLGEDLNRTIPVVLAIFLICAGLGSFIVYRYVIHPIEGDFPHEEDLVEVEAGAYVAVRDIWNERDERFEKAGERSFADPFFPFFTVPPAPVEEEITAAELEELLARTLFEFYEMRGEGMPPISERALIWEELGLGSAQEYRGIYSQNILLLGILMEMLNDKRP